MLRAKVQNRHSGLKKRERFINNDVLESVSRPQHRYSCSLSALTAVINFLYSEALGIQTQEMVAERLGMVASEVGYDGGPENEDLLKWFRKLLKQTGRAGTCRCYLGKGNVKDFSKNETVFRHLKDVIKSRDQILIYHLDNHYNIVCGFFESAETPSEAFAPDPYLYRWIVLADHYPRTDPLYSIRWKQIREDFIDDSEHCFLLFER